MTSRHVLSALALLISGAMAAGAEAGEFFQRSVAAGPDPASRTRVYQVYVPDDVAADGSAPLVMVLHGCRQTEDNMIAETRFVELADQHGFVVAFPFVTGYSEVRNPNCWGFWFEQHRHEGRGEVGDLRRIAAAVEAEFATDPGRRYIAGLSSGAAMAVVAAVAYSEDFAAAGAVAGLPYGEDAAAVGFFCGAQTSHHGVAQIVRDMRDEQPSAEERRVVPLLVMQSLHDCTVPIQNGVNLRDSWVQHYGALTEPVAEASCSAEGVPCTRRTFARTDGEVVLEEVFYQGEQGARTHYWPGDNEGEFANARGPSATDLLWAFFADKSLEPVPAEISIDEVSVAGRSITVTGTAEAELEIAGVSVRLEGENPRSESLASGVESWTVTFEDLEDDSFYTPVATVVLADGRSTSVAHPPVPVGDPSDVVEEVANWQAHMAAGRLAVQIPPCLPGFGACDASFAALFLEHGFEAFPLFAREGESLWFADPADLD